MNLFAFLLFIFLRHSPGNAEVKKSESSMCADSKELIENHIRDLGKRRISVPGDGHCILHAFSQGVMEIEGHQNEYSVTSLLPKIKEEVLGDLEHYSPFIGDTDDIDLVSELESYIIDRKYDSCVVDVMPHVLANVTHTSVSVLYVDEVDGRVRTHTIPPTKGTSKRTIFVCKIGMHYDATLHQDEEAAISEGKPDMHEVVCYFLRI